MHALDDQALEQLADIICGDNDSVGPKYRQGWKLPLFFRAAGLNCIEHDGSTRKWWTLDRLREYNTDPELMEKVIIQLANPREYGPDVSNTREVIDVLNQLLAIEGLHVELDGIVPVVREREPALPGETPTVQPQEDPGGYIGFVTDAQLAAVLQERWCEVGACIGAGAHVAAVIMMGSLLEGALLAAAQTRPREANQSAHAPRNRAGDVKPFAEWRLSELIDVAVECGWVHGAVRDFSQMLRDYRNIIHPRQQCSSGHSPDDGACAICWQVTKEALRGLQDNFGGHTMEVTR